MNRAIPVVGPLSLLLACAPPASEDTGAVDSTSGFEEVDYRILKIGEASGSDFLTDDASEFRDGSLCEDRMEVNIFSDEAAFERWATEAILGTSAGPAPDWATEVAVAGTLDCTNALNDFDVEAVWLDEPASLHVSFLRHNVDCTDGGLVTRVFATLALPAETYAGVSAEWREAFETGCFE